MLLYVDVVVSFFGADPLCGKYRSKCSWQYFGFLMIQSVIFPNLKVVFKIWPVNVLLGSSLLFNILTKANHQNNIQACYNRIVRL